MDGDGITLTLPSSLAAIQWTMGLAEEYLKDCGSESRARVAVVLRELLANAITHGNRGLRDRHVYCEVRREPEDTVVVVVEDEGEGFDYHGLDTTVPEDARGVLRRGYLLIRSIASTVEFNPRGNRVTVRIAVA